MHLQKPSVLRRMLIGAVLIGGLALAWAPASASARADSVRLPVASHGYFEVRIDATSYFGVRGRALLYAGSNREPSGTATIYVVQCRGDATHCVTVAARRDSFSRAQGYFWTSGKVPSWGHVYKACASYQGMYGSYVNVCTPFVTND